MASSRSSMLSAQDGCRADGIRIKGGGVEFWMKRRQYLMLSFPALVRTRGARIQ